MDYDYMEVEKLAKQRLNDPNPDIARKAAAALQEIQQMRSPQGLAQMYSSASGYANQLGQMKQNSPWAGMRTLEAQKFDADTTGMVNGQKTWARQKDEASYFGKLNDQWTQAGRANEAAMNGIDPMTGKWTQSGRINESNMTGIDPSNGRMTYNTQVQERGDYGIDPVTGRQTMNKINNDRNYNLNVRQENRMANAAKAKQPEGLKYTDYYKEVQNRLNSVTESPRSYTDAKGNVKELSPSKTPKYKQEEVIDYILTLPIDDSVKERLIMDTGLYNLAKQMGG
jgi:hypothetical protein